MGDRYLLDLADVCRDAGLRVVEYAGWQTRSRGSGGYETGWPDHVMVHHTASPPSWSGQRDADYCAVQDEDAPLSNLCLDRDGVVWILAAGATNTNGKGSDWWGGGVGDDDMNRHAIGVEANGGYGEAWPDVQCDAYVVLTAALCDRYGISTNCVRGHFEWAPERKVDPAGPSPWAVGSASWNMDNFRVTCANEQIGGGESEADMPLSDDDVQRIAEAVWAYEIDTTARDAGIEPEPAGHWLQRTFLIVREYLGKFPGRPPTDPSMLAEIHNNTKR